MLDRFSSTAFVASAAAAALAVFALAFLVGRMTAPSSTGATGPALAPLHAPRATVTLPHLSQAVPLAGLRSAPAPVVQPAPPVVAPPRVHRSKPKRAGAPVDIVGSG